QRKNHAAPAARSGIYEIGAWRYFHAGRLQRDPQAHPARQRRRRDPATAIVKRGGDMAQVTQLVIRGEHKPGTLAQICSELAKVAVNITAIMAANTEEHGIRLVAAPHAAAKKVLDGLRISYTEDPAIAVRLGDRPGALGRVTRKLADAGINVTY